MASGNAVCGSSAIGATVPVVNATDKEKGIAVTIVNVTGIFLMFLLPIISQFLYSHELVKTSAMIGGTLQSIGQVVASGAIVGENVKDLATIFKIVRVIFLVVVVLVFGHMKNQSNREILEEEKDEIKRKSNYTMVCNWILYNLCTFFNEYYTKRSICVVQRNK